MKLEATDLANHIAHTSFVDTHEHMRNEPEILDRPPDLLTDLFNNYITADLVVAGASQEAVDRLVSDSDPDVAGRFTAVKGAWERCRHTGYGEAVSIVARELYDIAHIDSESLVAAQPLAARYRAPGARLHLLRDKANLDHVQVDDFRWDCVPDPSGPNFFLYDLSWQGFCSGRLDLNTISAYTGIEIASLADLDSAMQAIFERNAPFAIAVKSQHAYDRTLVWQEREAGDAARVLDNVIAGHEIDNDQRLCLGDWCWAKGVELSIRYKLPFKLHTGYYAGHSRMPVDFIKSGNLCPLLKRYGDAKFVLMHIAYPYNDELVALAKHYPNVYADMCWAWSIDPYSASQFVRQMIHAAPRHKLLGFGGDSWWPAATVGYAIQARKWLTFALQTEIESGMLTEPNAIGLATDFMAGNARDCFDIEGARSRIAAASL